MVRVRNQHQSVGSLLINIRDFIRNSAHVYNILIYIIPSGNSGSFLYGDIARRMPLNVIIVVVVGRLGMCNV